MKLYKYYGRLTATTIIVVIMFTLLYLSYQRGRTQDQNIDCTDFEHIPDKRWNLSGDYFLLMNHTDIEKDIFHIDSFFISKYHITSINPSSEIICTYKYNDKIVQKSFDEYITVYVSCHNSYITCSSDTTGIYEFYIEEYDIEKCCHV